MNRYDWHPWFAWYPVRLAYEINESPGFSYTDSGVYAWLRWVECRVHGEVAPNGDLTDWWEYRAAPRRTTPCPYCPNPDRDFWIYDKNNSSGACKFDVPAHGGSDPPCVCDNYGTLRGY